MLILVLVITPNVELPNEEPGLENSGVLVALKTSMRNWSEWLLAVRHLERLEQRQIGGVSSGSDHRIAHGIAVLEHARSERGGIEPKGWTGVGDAHRLAGNQIRILPIARVVLRVGGLPDVERIAGGES